MSDIAVSVEGIGKKYRIGKKKSGELRETFSHFWDFVRHKGDAHHQKEDTTFWALKDISFEVKQGEAIGIIGRNGAGKSTLLKVLSRITKPTTGRFEINGRVSSLLEVGTGFHPELTGRENIFLNGTILGMRRAEIKAKFDEIIDFSGVEEFIDTPVKHYSSGMKVRLAFAVAAHLEPEILIIDEVLAVGDAEFQKKCLGKMEDVTGEGRTVLFVSHNMGAVERLCQRGIIIDKGILTSNSNIKQLIELYLNRVAVENVDNSDNAIIDLSHHKNKKYDNNFGLQKVSVKCDDQLSRNIYVGCKVSFEFEIVIKNRIKSPRLGIVIKSINNEPIIGLNNWQIGDYLELKLSPERNFVVFNIPYWPIYTPGVYIVDLFLGESNEDFDTILTAFTITNHVKDIYNSGKELYTKLNKVAIPQANFSIK